MRKNKNDADKKYGLETGFKADAMGKTKDGKKFVLKALDFRYDMKHIRKCETFGATLKIWDAMKDLKGAMKTNKNLKDVKLLIFSLPKDQSTYKLPAKCCEGSTLLDFVKRHIESELKYMAREDGDWRERTKEERYPFKVEVRVV